LHGIETLVHAYVIKSVQSYQAENLNTGDSADTRQWHIDKALPCSTTTSAGENACRTDCGRPRRRSRPDAAGVNRKGQ
jgi:hypothetical protein